MKTVTITVAEAQFFLNLIRITEKETEKDLTDIDRDYLIKLQAKLIKGINVT